VAATRAFGEGPKITCKVSSRRHLQPRKNRLSYGTALAEVGESQNRGSEREAPAQPVSSPPFPKLLRDTGKKVVSRSPVVK